MSNPFDLSELSFENKDFWCFFLSIALPDAYTNDDTSISDLISLRYSFSTVWVENFIQYSRESIEHRDGLVDAPTLRMLRLGKRGCGGLLIVQFHPGAILYYSNGNKIASLEPHYKTHYFTWKELLDMANYSENGDILFLLLLPITSICKGEEEVAQDTVAQKLKKIPILTSLADELAECIIRANFDSFGFVTDPDIGLISRHPNSLRKPQKQGITEHSLSVLNHTMNKITPHETATEVADLYKKIDTIIGTAIIENQEILFSGLLPMLQTLREYGENVDTAYEHFLDMHQELLRTNFPASELAGWLMKHISKVWDKN